MPLQPKVAGGIQRPFNLGPNSVRSYDDKPSVIENGREVSGCNGASSYSLALRVLAQNASPHFPDNVPRRSDSRQDRRVHCDGSASAFQAIGPSRASFPTSSPMLAESAAALLPSTPMSSTGSSSSSSLSRDRRGEQSSRSLESTPQDRPQPCSRTSEKPSLARDIFSTRQETGHEIWRGLPQLHSPGFCPRPYPQLHSLGTVPSFYVGQQHPSDFPSHYRMLGEPSAYHRDMMLPGYLFDRYHSALLPPGTPGCFYSNGFRAEDMLQGNRMSEVVSLQRQGVPLDPRDGVKSPEGVAPNRIHDAPDRNPPPRVTTIDAGRDWDQDWRPGFMTDTLRPSLMSPHVGLRNHGAHHLFPGHPLSAHGGPGLLVPPGLCSEDWRSGNPPRGSRVPMSAASTPAPPGRGGWDTSTTTTTPGPTTSSDSCPVKFSIAHLSGSVGQSNTCHKNSLETLSDVAALQEQILKSRGCSEEARPASPMRYPGDAITTPVNHRSSCSTEIALTLVTSSSGDTDTLAQKEVYMDYLDLVLSSKKLEIEESYETRRWERKIKGFKTRSKRRVPTEKGEVENGLCSTMGSYTGPMTRQKQQQLILKQGLHQQQQLPATALNGGSSGGEPEGNSPTKRSPDGQTQRRPRKRARTTENSEEQDARTAAGSNSTESSPSSPPPSLDHPLEEEEKQSISAAGVSTANQMLYGCLPVTPLGSSHCSLSGRDLALCGLLMPRCPLPSSEVNDIGNGSSLQLTDRPEVNVFLRCYLDFEIERDRGIRELRTRGELLLMALREREDERDKLTTILQHLREELISIKEEKASLVES